MLAVIDPSGGGATSNSQLLTLNALRAIQAIATLPAGSSIPTVNAIVQSNTTANAIVLSTANQNLGMWYFIANAATTPLVGSTVYGLSTNTTISAVKTASYTATASTTTLTVTAVASGNLEPAMVLGGTSVVPNNYITGQLTVNATGTPVTLSTTATATTGQTTITIASNTGILAGQIIANTTGGLTYSAGANAIPAGTYVGAFYSNGVPYTGNTTVPLKNFGNGDVTVATSMSANAIGFFTAGKTGTYSLGVSHTSGTINSGNVYTLATPQTATTTAVVNVVSFSTNNCVTALISNTTAGGWSVSSNNTCDPSYSGANNTSGGLLLDLYVQNTNKSTYPYHKIAFRQNPSVPFSNTTYASFNYIYAYHGASASPGYSDGTFSAFSGPSAIVNQRTTPTSASGFGAMLANDGPFMIATTANYMHLISNNYIISMGYRDTQAWEDAYNDNPPVYNFSVDLRTNSTSNHYPASSFMWARYVNNTGTIQTPSRFQYAYTGAAVANQPNPVTAVDMNAGNSHPPNSSDLESARVGYSGGPIAPLFHLTTHYTNGSYVISYPPGYDSSNSTFVPCAYPIVLALSKNNVFNGGGKANGIFKSLSSGGYMTMSSYYTANATYTIGGDDYYPVLSGTSNYDLFLVRKT